MKDLVTKTFNDQQIRIVEVDNEPWFVAKDVANALDIGRTHDAIRRLDDDEKGADSIRVQSGPAKGHLTEMNIIKEAGVYRLIFTSRKPEADKDKLQGYSYCEYPLVAIERELIRRASRQATGRTAPRRSRPSSPR